MFRAEITTLVNEWCDRLESGKYKQGKVFLKHVHNCNVTYCCLGVLMDLLSEKRKDIAVKVVHNKYDGTFFTYNDSRGRVPEKLAHELRMENGSGGFMQEGVYNALTVLNDYGHNFNDIAEIIRKNKFNIFTPFGEQSQIHAEISRRRYDHKSLSDFRRKLH